MEVDVKSIDAKPSIPAENASLEIKKEVPKLRSVKTYFTNEVESEATTSKLGQCEVCGYHNSKYCCPKCEVKTCSLRCNKIHKLEIECDGCRDRAKFIPINKFSNMDLSSDLRLLEEISRTLETSKKSFGRKIQHEIPTHLFKLRNAAKTRNTNLKFLPYKFARRRNNSSQLSYKNNVICWHIEWIFVNADNLKLIDRKVVESERLSSMLHKYLVKPEDPDLEEPLQYYRAVDLPGVRIFLKAEQKVGRKFYELDANSTLRECLQKKLIIEYPTIHVVLKEHADSYDVIDSDDEVEMEEELPATKSGKEMVNRMISSADSDESLYKSLKNLLFIGEYSGEEASDSE